MLIEILLCGVGLLLLSVAADHLVRGCARLAIGLRINPLVVGVVVIGLGTSAPEFLVSGSAAARGETGIAMGNIVGSNVINLSLILGTGALISVVRVQASVITREIRLSLAAVAVFGLAAWAGLTPVTGVVLAALQIGALILLVRWARAVEPVSETPELGLVGRPHHVGLESVRALGGLSGVLVGAQLVVTNASSIATRFGIPQVVIGLTLVALGTSLPELVTTIQAQRQGESGLAVGNLFGSNLFNSLTGGALIGVANRSGQPAQASLVFVLVMIAGSVLAWALLRRGLRLTATDGLILLGGYALIIPLLMA